MSIHIRHGKLLQNFPNPFNNATFIVYKINSSKQEHVNLSIYNVLGQKVKTITDEFKSSGTYDYLWEAKDDNNRRVSSGTYFLILQKEREVRRTKMVLLK
ncbi:MAG: T9SS type A sorting domain-containing protein [candidate division Zixibacteria bacterium]|nr:T9SS type A sorting domain-containing protein [candidate division Zixibacteria bacterium]